MSWCLPVCRLMVALSLSAPLSLSAQVAQPQLPRFVRGELITQANAPLQLYQLITFEGDKEWSGAKVTWRYPISPDDEVLWGPSVAFEDQERVIQERLSTLSSFDLETLDRPTQALVRPMLRAASQLKERDEARPISIAEVSGLYPAGLPARVRRPMSDQLSSYSTLVPNTWVLWLLTPRAELREADHARYARIFSTLKENSRPQDRAILIEGSEAIKASSFVPSLEEWTPELWTSSFKMKRRLNRPPEGWQGVARVEILRSIMRNLIHELSAVQMFDTRCGQPCSYVIPNMNILIFADEIDATELESIYPLVRSKTNVFYGAHIIQVAMSNLKERRAQPSPLSELRLGGAPAQLPHVVTQSSLSEVFKQINDWRDRRFVVQPLTEISPYYWGSPLGAWTAELYAHQLKVKGQLSVPLPPVQGELSEQMTRQHKRYLTSLERLRGAERLALEQRKLTRIRWGGGLVIAFVLWLLLTLKRRQRHRLTAPRAPSPAPSLAPPSSPAPIDTGSRPARPHVGGEPDEGEGDEHSADEHSDTLDHPSPWADSSVYVQGPPLPGEPAKGEQRPKAPSDDHDGAGPYIPTTSDHSEDTGGLEDEALSESSAEREGRLDEGGDPFGESSNPWYDRGPSAPPAEHGARLADDEYIHYESDPPASPKRDVDRGELNTAPYGASIVIRVDEAALFAMVGPLKGRVFRVNRTPAYVGRGRGVDCKLPSLDDLTISRRHCTLTQKSSEAWEIMCMSPAGLYVNSALIREGETQTLYDKDLLTLGRSRFLFRLGPIGVEEYPQGASQR